MSSDAAEPGGQPARGESRKEGRDQAPEPAREPSREPSREQARDPVREAGSLPEEFLRLEGAVRGLLDEVAGYRARAQVAERRAAELERTLRDMSSGALDPIKLKDGLRRLEEENRELRRRIVEAQDRIRHLIARFDFLREEM